MLPIEKGRELTLNESNVDVDLNYWPSLPPIKIVVI
jgi:hypothetical protein